MLKYKVDILQALKSKGYSTFRLRKDKLFGEATIQKFRNSEMVSWDKFNLLCKLLDCQPGDILIYERDSE